MVWTHLCEAAEISFDVQLLEQIEQKRDEEVESILQKEKDLWSAVDISGASLLHYAAEFGNEDITAYLIMSGSNINLQDKNGNTPLSLATKHQQVNTIEVLLDYEAEIYICDNGGSNPLQLALQASPINVEIAKLFLRRVSNECSSDGTEIARILMKIDCPIYVAVLLENVGVTKCMLSEGCAIDAKDPESGKTALHVAVENIDLDHVEKLVFLGANVNANDSRGKPPLAMLSDFSESMPLSIVKILLKGKSSWTRDYYDKGYGYLRSIMENGTKEIVIVALESLSDVTLMDQHEDNVMHYLASNRNKGIVQVVEDFKLLDKLHINARNLSGWTALHFAVNAGNANFAEYLIKNGANVHVASRIGLTAFLHVVNPKSKFVSEYDRARCVKILLASKAKPDIFLGQYFKVHDAKSAINRDFVLLEPVVAMLALLKAVDKPFNREILLKIESHPKLKEHFDNCMDELEKMKGEKAYKSVNVLDILAGSDNAKGTKGSIIFWALIPRVRRAIWKYRSITIYNEILFDKTNKMIRENYMLTRGFLILASVIFLIICFYAIYRALTELHNYTLERIGFTITVPPYLSIDILNIP